MRPSAFTAELPDFKPAVSYAMTAARPRERVDWALNDASIIHPKLRDEFQSGFAVAWHRFPGSLGCFAMEREGSADLRRALRDFDGRVALAGEHVSDLSGWQEGAILSAVDCVERLHARVRASGRVT